MRPPSEVWPEKWRYLRRITRAQLTWRLKQINEINNYPSAAVLLRPLYAIRSDRQMSPARPRDHRRIPPPCGHGAGVITTVVAAAAVEGAPPTYPSYPSPRTLFQGSHSHGRSPVGGGGRRAPDTRSVRRIARRRTRIRRVLTFTPPRRKPRRNAKTVVGRGDVSFLLRPTLYES